MSEAKEKSRKEVHNLLCKLYEMRRQMRLSQTELANKLGVSLFTISRWERGICQPDSPKHINRIRRMLEGGM